MIDALKSVARTILPFAKKAGKFALREGLRQAPDLMLSENKPSFFKQAVKDTTMRGFRQLAAEVAHERGRNKKKHTAMVHHSRL